MPVRGVFGHCAELAMTILMNKVCCNTYIMYIEYVKYCGSGQGNHEPPSSLLHECVHNKIDNGMSHPWIKEY